MSVSADDVKFYRESHGIGLEDARRILEKEDRDARLFLIKWDLERGKRPDDAIAELIEIVREMNA